MGMGAGCQGARAKWPAGQAVVAGTVKGLMPP